MGFSKIKSQELIKNGYLLLDFPLTHEMRDLRTSRDWYNLDQIFLKESLPTGILYQFLSQYVSYTQLEHIIAIRTPPDDDGIWHDDGSRTLGFSLSLNQNEKSIKGGELLFKLKTEQSIHTFSPLPMGKMVIFLTGIYGFEHKVNQVLEGERVVIAGWASH